MMRKLLLYFGMCISLNTFFSCDADPIMDNANNISTKSSSMLNEPYFVDDNGALVFRTVDDYFALSDSIVKLSDEEYEEWSNRNHFYSYRQYVQML